MLDGVAVWVAFGRLLCAAHRWLGQVLVSAAVCCPHIGPAPMAERSEAQSCSLADDCSSITLS